jgi:hypothetical protein
MDLRPNIAQPLDKETLQSRVNVLVGRVELKGSFLE